MGRSGLSYLLVLALGCGLVACGDDDDGTPVDAGPDGSPVAGSAAGRGGVGGSSAGTGAAGGTAGAGTGGSSAGTGGSAGTMAMPPLECGDTECPALDPMSAMLGVTACCTADNGCGLMTMLAPGCLPRNSPGGVDSSCPMYMSGMVNWFGCCTPEGKCGAMAGGTLGCVPNSSLMAADQNCNYDPQNTCTRIVDVACDGAEDCPGQKCCAVYQGGYRKFECADDCAVADMPPQVYSSEACHPGEACSVAGYSCFQNLMILPDYLFRCRDTGDAPANTSGSTAANEINCGDAVCGAGQKCCISVPGEAVCVPKARNCPCVPEGGELDGGML